MRDSPGRLAKISLLSLAAPFLFSGLLHAFLQTPDDGTTLSPRLLADNLAAKTYSGRHIDLVFSRSGLQDVIAYLEKVGGIPLKLDPSINSPVTYRMLDVPWDEALATVLSDNTLNFMLNLDGSGLKIGRGERIVLAFPDEGRAKLVLFLYKHFLPIAAGIVAAAALGAVLGLWRRRRSLNRKREKKALLPPAAAEQVKSGLSRLLKDERLYRDADLSLQALAEKLGVSTHQLSWVLNEELKVSFSSLINGFRVEDVKSRLADQSFNGSSILQTAMEAGFNSKAAFNRAFKLHTGVTPSKYKRSLPR